jgi:hypothetical protein
LWSASSGWKISQTRPLPEEKTNKLQIRLAKNETEAIQLVLFPKEEISDFKVTCGKLKGPCGYTIEQKDISVLRVKYLFISNPTDWTSEAGFWPDPLPELSLQNANLIPNQNNPLWIRVYASKNIMAGIYKGEIKLTGKDFRHTIPLEVEIYNFELPDRKSCKTSVSIMPHYIWKYHNVDKIEDKRLILDMYWKNFSKHSISPYEPTPLDPIKFKWPSTKDIQEIAKTTSLSKNILIDILFDWKEWDNAMRKAFELYHFNSFRIKIPGMGKLDWKYKKEPELLGFKDNTLEYKILFNSWCKAYRDHLKEKGWLKYGYAHCFDEPRPEYYDFVMRGFKKLKRIIPDVKRLLTEQPEPELIGGPNIWVPVTSHYNEKNVETCKSAGDEFWWYICCSPVAPYCSIHIDHPATELRVWLWQTWKRGIKGIHHWNATFWTSQKKYTNSLQDPYTDGMTWSGNGAPYGYGDGRLIYPPEKFLFNKRGEPIYSQPVDSIRWEMLRDGIEDYEYLEILKELYKKYSCGLPVETRKKIADAIKIPDELTKSLTEFTKTPSIIEKKRHKIAKSIEEIFETISCSYEK